MKEKKPTIRFADMEVKGESCFDPADYVLVHRDYLASLTSPLSSSPSLSTDEAWKAVDKRAKELRDYVAARPGRPPAIYSVFELLEIFTAVDRARALTETQHQQERDEAAASFFEARQQIARLIGERDEARQFAEMAAKKYNDFVAECAENTAVTCAFCGTVYPEGTPRSGHGALAEHIRVCEKHPLRAAEADRLALRARVDALETALEALTGPEIDLAGTEEWEAVAACPWCRSHPHEQSCVMVKARALLT